MNYAEVQARARPGGRGAATAATSLCFKFAIKNSAAARVISRATPPPPPRRVHLLILFGEIGASPGHLPPRALRAYSDHTRKRTIDFSNKCLCIVFFLTR